MMSITNLREAGVERSPIVVGAIVGLLAGIPTGIVLQLGTELMSVFGGIIGTESVVVGWLLHLVMSAVFGAFFGWHVEWPVFRTLTNSVAGSVLWGVIFGIVWYAYVVVGVVVPGVSELLGASSGGHPLGQIPGPALEDLLPAAAFSLAYILWGGLLGFGYATLESERAEPDHRGPDADQETLGSE